MIYSDIICNMSGRSLDERQKHFVKTWAWAITSRTSCGRKIRSGTDG